MKHDTPDNSAPLLSEGARRGYIDREHPIGGETVRGCMKKLSEVKQLGEIDAPRSHHRCN